MNKIEKLLAIAKDSAASYLKEGEIDEKKIYERFDKKNAIEIIEKMKNSSINGENEKLIKIINKSKQKEWKNLKVKLRSPFKLHFLYSFSKVAAVFLGLVVTYFLLNSNLLNIDESILIIEEEVITLRLDNGDIEKVSVTGQRMILNQGGKVIGNKKGAALNYVNTEVVEDEVLSYNELNIPYGKTFELVLSDGTVVHLNAGTTIKYPVKFLKGEVRSVFLNGGEAYFDVAEDKKHPFVVKVNDLNVRVLGTHFNVSAYPEDNVINTVLVEGAVSLYEENEIYDEKTASLLKPGYIASWDKKMGTIDKKRVDTFIYTAWMDGKIIFDHVPFKDIIKKLERHYNVSIINTNVQLGEETFTARFDIETIEQVLNSFNKNYAIEYVIENNKILIK